MSKFETTIRLLEADIAATLGPQYRDWARGRAATVSELDVHDKSQKLVDDVQDLILELVQSEWPMCPRHPHHPLWFEEGAWRCKAEPSIVVALGSLK